MYVVLLRMLEAKDKSLGIGLMSFLSRLLGKYHKMCCVHFKPTSGCHKVYAVCTLHSLADDVDEMQCRVLQQICSLVML